MLYLLHYLFFAMVGFMRIVIWPFTGMAAIVQMVLCLVLTVIDIALERPVFAVAWGLLTIASVFEIRYRMSEHADFEDLILSRAGARKARILVAVMFTAALISPFFASVRSNYYSGYATTGLFYGYPARVGLLDESDRLEVTMDTQQRKDSVFFGKIPPLGAKVDYWRVEVFSTIFGFNREVQFARWNLSEAVVTKEALDLLRKAYDRGELRIGSLRFEKDPVSGGSAESGLLLEKSVDGRMPTEDATMHIYFRDTESREVANISVPSRLVPFSPSLDELFGLMNTYGSYTYVDPLSWVWRGLEYG